LRKLGTLMIKKQPIIFDDTSAEDYVEGEQTMDLLLHYAEAGISDAEILMRQEPDMFTEEEIMDFAANKVILAKAPDILEEYKKKLREFELMNEKIENVLSKCENIVERYDVRKLGKNEKQAGYSSGGPLANPGQAKIPTIDPGLIRYTADGEMMIKPQKKVVIELKKSEDY